MELLEKQDAKLLQVDGAWQVDEIYEETHEKVAKLFTYFLSEDVTRRQLFEAVVRAQDLTDAVLPIPPLPLPDALKQLESRPEAAEQESAAEGNRTEPSPDFKWLFMQVDADVWSILQAAGTMWGVQGCVCVPVCLSLSVWRLLCDQADCMLFFRG